MGTVTIGLVKGLCAAAKQAAAPPHSVWPTIITVYKGRGRWKENNGWDAVDNGEGKRKGTVFNSYVLDSVGKDGKSAGVIRIELTVARYQQWLHRDRRWWMYGLLCNISVNENVPWPGASDD